MDDSGLIIQRQVPAHVRPVTQASQSPHAFASASSGKHDVTSTSPLEILVGSLSPSPRQLTFLSLAGCNLSNDDIQPSIWQLLPSLIVANLSRNRLTIVPSELFTLSTTPSLWSVDLSMNELRFFPPLVHQRPMLGVLNLAGNADMPLSVFQEGIRGFVCGEVVAPLCLMRTELALARDCMLGVLSVCGELMPPPSQPLDSRCETYHIQLRRKCRLWGQRMLLDQFKLMFSVNSAELPQRQQEIAFRSAADALLRLASAAYRVASTNVVAAGGSFGMDSKTGISIGFATFSSVNAVLDGPPFGQEVWESGAQQLLEEIAHLIAAWSTCRIIPLSTVHCAAIGLLDSSESAGGLAAIARRYPLYAWYAVCHLLQSMKQLVSIPKSFAELNVEFVAHAIEHAKASVGVTEIFGASDDITLTCEVPTALKELVRARATERSEASSDPRVESERRDRSTFRAMLFSRMSQTNLSIPPRAVMPLNSSSVLDGSPQLGMRLNATASSACQSVQHVLDELNKHEHDTSFVHKDFFRANTACQARLKERQESMSRLNSASGGRLTPISRVDVSLPIDKEMESAAVLDVSRISTSASRARMRAGSGSEARSERTSHSRQKSSALPTVTMVDFLKSRGTFREQNEFLEKKIRDALEDEETTELIRREKARMSTGKPGLLLQEHQDSGQQQSSALISRGPSPTARCIVEAAASLAWTSNEMEAVAKLLNGDRELANDFLSYIAARQRPDHSSDATYRTLLAAFWVTAPQCQVDLATCGQAEAHAILDRCLYVRQMDESTDFVNQAALDAGCADGAAPEKETPSGAAYVAGQHRHAAIDGGAAMSQIPSSMQPSPQHHRPEETAGSASQHLRHHPQPVLAARPSTTRPTLAASKLTQLPPRSSSAKSAICSSGVEQRTSAQQPTSSHPFVVAAQEEMARQRLRAEIKRSMREADDPVIEHERRRACSATMKNVRAGQFEQTDQHMFIPALVRDHLKGRPLTAPRSQT